MPIKQVLWLAGDHNIKIVHFCPSQQVLVGLETAIQYNTIISNNIINYGVYHSKVLCIFVHHSRFLVGLETTIHTTFKQYNNCVYHCKFLGVLGPLFSAQYWAQCTELGGGGSMRYCGMGVPSGDRYLSPPCCHHRGGRPLLVHAFNLLSCF